HRQWQYDAAGRLTAAMDSVWGDKHYRHNVLNQLISVRSRNHEEIYGYRASGALIEAREGDQGSGRLVLNEGSVLRATENFEYEVDACNRRTVKRDKRTGKTVQYV